MKSSIFGRVARLAILAILVSCGGGGGGGSGGGGSCESFCDQQIECEMFTEDFKDECIEYCVEIEAPYYDLGCLSELSCEDLEFYSYDQCELQVLPSRECQEVCGIMADCARQRGKDVSRDEIEGCEQGCTRYASGTEMTCIINASSCVAAEACVNTGDIEQELTSTPLFSR